MCMNFSNPVSMKNNFWSLGEKVTLYWDSSNDWSYELPQTTDYISISGEVVYVSGDDVILRVIEKEDIFSLHTLSYNLIRHFYTELYDAKADKKTEYFAWNIDFKKPIFFVDPDLGYIDKVFKENDEIDYEQVLDPCEADALNTGSQTIINLKNQIIEQLKMLNEKQINIVIPDEAIDLFNGKEYKEDPDKLYYGLPRAMHWMETKDCAVLTAWRKCYTYEVNSSNNEELQKALRDKGFGVAKVKGMYAEVGKKLDSERSFLVVDLLGDSDTFYKIVYDFSEKYEQDCFLYKKAGIDSHAYLIGTNEDFIKENGPKQEAGYLSINNKKAQAYTEVGSGRISFN